MSSVARTKKFHELRPLPSPKELAAPPFPIEFLPGPFGGFVSDIAERLGVRPDIPAVAMITATASLLGNEVRIRLKRYDNWLARPTIWAAVIGPPASYKTPALQPIIEIIANIEKERREEYENQLKDYEDKLVAAKEREKAWLDSIRKGEASFSTPRPNDAVAPEKPKLARLLANDATLEVLIAILNESDGRLTLFADELVSIFKRFNQYRGGADREFFLALHAGSSYAYDRKSSESVTLEQPFANILGGTQPSKLSVFVEDGPGDGLQARFSLMCWPEPMSEFKYVDRAPDHKAQHAVEGMFRRFITITDNGPVTLKFSDKAQARFERWYKLHRKRLPRLEPTLQAHYGKYDGLFGGLCLVHYFMSGHSADQEVSFKTAHAVADLINNYLKQHALKVYGYAAESTDLRGAERISEFIKKNPDTTRLTRRDIKKHKWAGLKTDDAVERALQVLIKHGWIRKYSKASTGGRPTDLYIVNPEVWENF